MLTIWNQPRGDDWDYFLLGISVIGGLLLPKLLWVLWVDYTSSYWWCNTSSKRATNSESVLSALYISSCFCREAMPARGKKINACGKSAVSRKMATDVLRLHERRKSKQYEEDQTVPSWVTANHMLPLFLLTLVQFDHVDSCLSTSCEMWSKETSRNGFDFFKQIKLQSSPKHMTCKVIKPN